MDFNQFVFKNLIYYPVVWSRGQWVPAYLKSLLRSQYASPDAIREIQVMRLNNLIREISKNVPRYMHLSTAGALGPVRDVTDIRYLPFTVKTDLKTVRHELTSQRTEPFTTAKTTGGSTGQPVTLLKSRKALAWELAATWRGYSWANVSIGDRQARFWGVPAQPKARARAKLVDLVANRMRCSAFAFDDADLRTYTTALVRFRPHYFYGYVSMLSAYARFLDRTGQQNPFPLKCIITTSEVLTDTDRRLLESTFSAPVFNEYGSGELGSIAHQCEAGSLHVSAENMIVETLHGDTPCEAGQLGELVVTELNNYLTPLIRYRTGDFASLSATSCPCGRTLPVIENLFGRAYDTIQNYAGKLFHGEFMMYIFEDAERRQLGVQGFQVIQTSLRSFEIKIVPAPGYSALTEQFIRDQIRNKFDPDVEVHFTTVKQIPRAPSGKMRLIVGLQRDPATTLQSH